MSNSNSNIYVSTSVLEDNLPVRQAVTRLLDLGISNIELGSTHIYQPDIAATLDGLEADFIVHNFFPPAEDGLILNLASQDKEIRQASIQQMLRSIDFCRQMDIGHFSFHAGFISDPNRLAPDAKKRNYDFNFDAANAACRQVAFETFVESVRVIADYAAKFDIRIACENSGSIAKNDFLLMNTADEFEALFDLVDAANLGILLDIGHLRLASIANGFDAADFIRRVSPRVSELHVHDNDGRNDTHSPIMEDSWAVGMLKNIDTTNLFVTFEGRNTSTQSALSSKRILEDLSICI